MDRYNLGGICFSWDDGGYELEKGEYFEKFRIKTAENMEEIRFCGRLESIEPYTTNKKITETYSYEIYDVNGEQLIIYHWAKCKFAFAIWPDRIDCNRVNYCYFDPALKNDYIMNADWFFGMSGLHRALLQKQAPILHASYIDFGGQAILFTAPSQTGKSTQANLWREYAHAEIINGDRVLLRKNEGIWRAYGYPCCGSSKICINRTLPIRAIVILKQGVENKVIPISTSDKIRNIFTAIEVYRWDLNELEQTLRLAEEIVTEVQVLQLVCKPDLDAVRVLKEYLEATL